MNDRPLDATLTASEYEVFKQTSAQNTQQPGQSFLSEVARLWPDKDVSHQPIPEQTLWMNRYLTKRVLGQGGFGIVYLAEDISLHRLVALKIARPELLTKPEWMKRFQREAITAAALDHPNIVAVFDAGQSDGVAYMTCAYCPGIDLGKWLQQHPGRVPAKEAVTFISKVTESVAYLHVRGLVHRDLKPANILLTQDGISKSDLPVVVTPSSLGQATPKLTDFGLSQFVNIKHEKMIAGTPSYMAPEQAIPSNQVGPQVDVFALGAILYELLTGQPYRNASTKIKELTLPQQASVFDEAITKGIPENLLHIMQKCLQPQPQDRYSNAGELLQALQKYQGVEVSRGKQTWESRLGLLSLAALLLLVPLGYLMLHVQPKPPSKAISNSKFNPVQYALDVKQAHEALLRQDYSFGLQMLNRYSSPNLERHRGFIWGTLKRELESALRQKIQYRTEHAHPLVSMQFSADNKKYVTLDSSRLCLVRNWPQGDTLFSLQLELTPRFACFSPDGKLLVILCDGTPQQPASTIEIREASTGQLQRRLQSSGTVFTHLVFTENTKFAAAWHKTSDQSSGGIQLWQADQDVPYAELYTKKAGLAGPGGIVFSHQHQHLFVATSESSIDIWDLSSGQLHHRIRGMQQLAHCMTLSADGNTLAVASKKIPVDEYDELGEPRSEITLWDTSHFKLQDTIAGHSKNLINTLAFAHSDPNLLFAGYDHGLLQIWNISSKELVTEQQEMFRATGASSVLSDSHICFTTDQPDIAIWSPALVKNSLSIGEIWSLAISPDGKMLAVGADDENNAEKKCLFLLETGMILREPWNKQAHQATVSVVAFAPDGQALYTVGLDRKLKRWNLTTRKVDWEVEAHNERGIRDLAVSPDGQLLATSGLDSKVLLWEAATGKAAGQLTLRNGNNMAKLAFHPHQPWLAIATDDVMFVYDYPKQRYILQADQLGNSRILAFDADGEKLYVGGQKPIIHVFDMVSKTLLTVMNTSSASAMAISPDNKVLVCASHNGEIKFWYVPTGQELASLKTHTKDIYALVFSPDGRTLYAGSRDGKLLWWQSGD